MEFIKYVVSDDKIIAFNKQWVASKTLAEFKEHEKHHGLTAAQYKEVYNLCKTDKPESIQ